MTSFSTRNDLYKVNKDFFFLIHAHASKKYGSSIIILTSKHLFRTFQVENESANYRLHVGGASGTAGDSFTSDHSHHLMMFTTRDRDNDRFFYSLKVLTLGAVHNKGIQNLFILSFLRVKSIILFPQHEAQ